ncbi:MAG: histidinol-phosphate aminotransferase family protein, partial [Candidatus Omnitrophota bacterium]
ARLGYSEDNIYITAGSDAGIKSVFEVFVEKEDSVALLDPTYAMFYVYTRMFQANLLKINYKKDLSLLAEDVMRTISEYSPKLLCIANPNSPTGTVLPPKDIEKILDSALKRNTVVLIDEAYYPFYPVSSVELISGYPNLVITRTFSKAMGLASARLGFVIGQSRIIEYLHKVRPMYETNAFAVKFAELIMENYHLVEKGLDEVKRAKAYLEKELADLKVPYFKSYANFILIDVGSPETGIRIREGLSKKKILIKAAFNNPVLENCIRVTVGNIEQMKYFVKNFRAFFEREIEHAEVA